jgi:hypothetical protein
MFRKFDGDLEALGFPQKTWNTMARRNQRRCEYAPIGDGGRQSASAAGDPTPSAAARSSPRARRAMPRFRQPAPERA